MKTISLFILAIIISLHGTACVDDAPYVPRDSIKPELIKDTIPPPPLPLTSAKKLPELFGTINEVMPRFPGCEDLKHRADKEECSKKKLLDFVYSNLQYPAMAKKNGVEGMVVVRFTVNKDGAISNTAIIRDKIGAGCGEEALRIVNLMIEQDIRWIPGEQRGRLVKVQYNLPVKFELSEEAKKKPAPPPPIPPTLPPKPKYENPYIRYEASPRFPGCEDKKNKAEKKQCSEDKLMNFIYSNLKYPEIAKKNNIEGYVIVRFTVEIDGSLSNIHIIRDIASQCGQEAKRIIQLMNTKNIKWIPAKLRNTHQSASAQYSVGIKFELPEEVNSSN